MSAPVLLICGKLRDAAAFSKEAATYLDWIRKGVFERVVLSSWSSELREHGDLLRSLAREGLEVVLADEPILRTPGYVLHQTKSLFHGLSELDPDDWVFKTRTDKVGWSLNFDPAFWMEQAMSQPPVGPESPFSRRMMVMGALLFQPFFMSDQIFVGTARDLKLIANHDIWYEQQHALLNTEQMIYFPPFRASCPFTEAFLSVNVGLMFAHLDQRAEIYRTMLDHPLYLSALREFMQALQSSFTLGLFAADDPSPVAATWEDLLDPGFDMPGTYVPAESGLRFCTSRDLPQTLLDMPISQRGPPRLRDACYPAADARDLKRDLQERLFARWPRLPEFKVPDRVVDGIRIVSARPPLVS